VINIVRTKIEAGFNRIRRINGLDELAAILFPDNKNHQKIFLSLFIELKYAPDQFLADFSHVPKKYDISERVLETVRAKMRKLGLIDHVSKFNKEYGYREGWVFSSKLSRSLGILGERVKEHQEERGGNQEQKDRDCLGYV
jgi:hypothetical protein